MTRCDACPNKYRPILGDGPEPCSVLALGERPGQFENKYGRVFCGPTGEELDDTYIPLAPPLRRNTIRVTNVVKCWALNNRTPSNKEVFSCAHHFLPGELERCQPEIIIAMGGSACRLFPGIKLDTHHGVPRRGSWGSWSGWVIPMFHPARGLHEGREMTMLLEDWARIGEWLASEETENEKDHFTKYAEVDVRGFNEYVDYAKVLGGPVAVDTESHGPRPWSIQASISPHTAVLLRLYGSGPLPLNLKEVIFHHAPADLPVLDRLGCKVRYSDTMQEAFQQGNLPQGLKPLVYRLFQQEMTSWEDVVWPASIRALEYWMTEAHAIAQADLSLLEVKRLKTKIKEIVKKGPMESLLTRLISHSDEEGEYDPWKRLDEFWSEDSNSWMTTHIEARLGPYPILGIGNCSMKEAISYACSDSDWTLQVANELARRRGELFHIAEGDRDK